MSLDIEDQYDKLYRYCYFRLQSRQLAEDVTQETFLRYLERYSGLGSTQAVKYLYTIARNLCTDEYRRRKQEPIQQDIPDLPQEEGWMLEISVRQALAQLSRQEQELLLLRYVNQVPLAAMGELYGLSRFALYRRIAAAAKKFRAAYEKGET